jgi:hypothetical protein
MHPYIEGAVARRLETASVVVMGGKKSYPVACGLQMQGGIHHEAFSPTDAQIGVEEGDI